MWCWCSIQCHQEIYAPKELVGEKYPNATHNEHLDGLVALRRETCTVNHQQKQVVVFRHECFETLEMYVVDHYSKVLEEGSEVHFFLWMERMMS
eukprot:7811550-Ditylum_brightwellii.AAC.1